MISLSKKGNSYNKSILQIDGLSTETKPTDFVSETDNNGNLIKKFYITNGSAFIEIDTGKKYLYDEENKAWYESGEGGGDSSEYAHSLELSINNTTYVMTATLKNEDGDVLGSPSSIDLPLETMVVSGSYDDNTKKIILTLNNGQTIEFSVADLVSGLQSEITSQSKLASDLVDDTNQTNKFVTSSEKTKIANALTSEEYNAGKTTPSGTTYNIDGTIYTVGDNAEVFNAYSNNKAIGNYSHAEGNGTTTLGKYSHAEGESTTASGPASHAEGAYTIASSAHQHVQGKCNIEDSNDKYAFIIGNGTENNRSNAFSIDWDGKIYVNNAVTGVDVSALATYIDSKIDTAGTGLTKSGTTIHHENSVTAKTTQGFAQIAYDTEGHITGSTAATTAQENAINSGVTAETVAQIATNTHDIAILKTVNATVFGFRINKNDSNPSTRVEYLYDAVGMTPAHMDFTNDVFDYGSWGSAWFVRDNRPVALKYDGTVDYELDHSDFTKKLDGTASDITDTAYGGNFMSEIPLCYIKRWEDSDYNYVAISDKPVNDSYKAYAHTNANGIIQPKIYLPMFKGSVVSSKLRSIAGQFLSSNTTGTDEVSYAEACGSGWQLWDWSKHELIADLLTLISRSTDSKGKFGNGDINSYRNVSPDYGKQPTGGYCSTVGDLSTFATVSKGQFYGKNDDTHHVTTFYIEDFWGNSFERCLGLNLDSGVYKVKMIPPYALNTDSTYTTVSSVSVPSNGWLKNISTGDYGGLPSQTGATETTGYCNQIYSNTSSVRLARFGGGCDNGSNCGYRCVALSLASSNAARCIGGSPCFNPL